MLIAIRKNKAPQTLAVRGCADKPLLNGSSFVVKADEIINHLNIVLGVVSRCENLTKPHIKKAVKTRSFAHSTRPRTRFYSKISLSFQASTRRRVRARDYNKISQCENLLKLVIKQAREAYNAGSKNRGSTRPVIGGLVLPLINVECLLTRRALSYGGVGQEQSPRCPRQLEHPHHIGGLQSKNRGGSHA